MGATMLKWSKNPHLTVAFSNPFILNRRLRAWPSGSMAWHPSGSSARSG
jgi:hypothetical protein